MNNQSSRITRCNSDLNIKAPNITELAKKEVKKLLNKKQKEVEKNKLLSNVAKPVQSKSSNSTKGKTKDAKNTRKTPKADKTKNKQSTNIDNSKNGVDKLQELTEITKQKIAGVSTCIHKEQKYNHSPIST